MSRNKQKYALIVRHVPREGLAAYGDPIEAAGYELNRLDVGDPSFAGADLLSPDLVILMGGPMGVYETHRHPWIAYEIERVSERLEHGLPTLGVCFGAQIMAAALGAEVYQGTQKEIGFAPIELSTTGGKSPLAALRNVPVLHWHGDTFDLPPGTELLASTTLYPNQAFRRGSNLLALQFHAEMGVDPRIEEWIDESADCLTSAALSPTTLRRAYAIDGRRAVNAGKLMIADWLAGLHTNGDPVVSLADTFSSGGAF